MVYSMVNFGYLALGIAERKLEYVCVFQLHQIKHVPMKDRQHCQIKVVESPVLMDSSHQEHMSRRRWRRSVQLPRTPGCHRNTNSSAILSKYGKCTSIGNGYCHTHTWIATPSSTLEFVFRWHTSYTLLCCLRRLICSCSRLYSKFIQFVVCSLLYVWSNVLYM